LPGRVLCLRVLIPDTGPVTGGKTPRLVRPWICQWWVTAGFPPARARQMAKTPFCWL